MSERSCICMKKPVHSSPAVYPPAFVLVICAVVIAFGYQAMISAFTNFD